VLEERRHVEQIASEVDALLSAELSRIDPLARRRTDETALERGYVEVRFTNALCARAAEPVFSEMLKRLRLPYRAVRNVEHICLRHACTGKGRMLERICRKLDI